MALAFPIELGSLFLEKPYSGTSQQQTEKGTEKLDNDLVPFRIDCYDS